MNVDAILQFDPNAFALAQQRVKSSPLELVEADYVQLSIVSKSLEADARARVREAQLAIVQANAAKSTPVQTKGTARAAPETHDEFLRQHGKKPATYKALFDAIDFVFTMLKPVKIRIETLEQANKDLQARVLELEAEAAARSSKVEA